MTKINITKDENIIPIIERDIERNIRDREKLFFVF